MPYSATLIAPDGRVVTVTSPADYNDLRYGRGYREPAPEKAKPAKATETKTGK